MGSSRSVVLAAPVRTALGTFGGSLKEVSAPDLGAAAIGASVARAGLRPDEIGTVVMGNVIQAGTKMNPARQAAIHARLPVSVPAMTVNRVCGSGAQAIVSAAHEVAAGAVDAAVAGGMENMDLAPYLIARGRWGYRMGDAELYDSMLRDGLNDAFSDQHSGWHTEDLAQKFQITRAAQDEWALRDTLRALEWAPDPLLLFGGDVNLRRPPEMPGLLHVAGNHVDHLFTTGRPGRDAAVLERGPLSDHPPVAVTI
jgi:acetyl-CoA C-acetyltransferase